jgi:hypothetical protein
MLRKSSARPVTRRRYSPREAFVSIAVRVRVQVTGHPSRGVREHDLALALPSGPVTAHQIIESAVRAEVSAYEARAEEAQFVRVVTERELRAELAGGAVRMGDVDRPGPVDATRAVDAALTAFDDGIFKLFAGDDEVGPADVVELSDGTAMLFLRLMPLAGG